MPKNKRIASKRTKACTALSSAVGKHVRAELTDGAVIMVPEQPRVRRRRPEQPHLTLPFFASDTSRVRRRRRSQREQLR